MDLSPLRIALVAQHHTQPQIVAKIEHACRELSDGLGALASLGHAYHLEEGLAPPSDEWPKTLFHFSDSPNGRRVYSPAEAAALGPGWSPDPIEAQRLGGIATQNAGKGGRGSVALPANIYSEFLTDDQRVAERTRLREEARAKLLSQRELKEQTDG